MEPLALKGVRPRVCKDCEPRPKPLKAPYPGPRCYGHHQRAKKAAKQARHERDSQQTYGMPPGFFTRLLAFQGHRCAICPRKLVRAQRDHDHAKVGEASLRGLLCRKCNDYLGYIRDDPVVVRRLARYLEDPPAQQLLMAYDGEEATP